MFFEPPAKTLLSHRVDVRLDLIRKNCCALVKLIAPAKLMAVVKGNGYGLGIVAIAECALQAGATALVVSNIEEAISLRRFFPETEILCLNFPTEAQLRLALIFNVTLAINDLQQLQRLVSANARAAIHVEIDTGLGRGGLSYGELEVAFDQISQFPMLKATGVFSHLFDGASLPHSRRQLDILKNALTLRNISVHLAATAGIALGPEFHLDAVRAGLGIIGLIPKRLRTALSVDLSIRWVSSVSTIYGRSRGDFIGYGREVRLTRDSRLALVPVGFSDGYPRCARGFVQIHGHICPLLVAATMNVLVVDVTDVPLLNRGDEVTLLNEEVLDVLLHHNSRSALIPNLLIGSIAARNINYIGDELWNPS